MIPYFFQPVGIANDLEVEAPPFGHSGLPDVLAFVVFIGVERWMVEVLPEEECLLVKCAPDFSGRLVIAPQEMRRKVEMPHLGARLVFLARSLADSRCSAAINAS
ncbi:MAG: hypothetical protein ABSH32_34855, partial [Bryobacteraceae bacterium]